MGNKKYMALKAIEKAGFKKSSEMVTVGEIKEFYTEIDENYLIYLGAERSITDGYKGDVFSDKVYRLLPKGEDYISNYEESRKSRKINLIAMWAAIGACVIGLLTLLLSLLK